MSAFASKTPRDLNHDPMPWSVGDPYGHELRSEIEAPENALVDWCEFAPRPEFDHVQHNAPNPILVEFRENVAEDKQQGIPFNESVEDMVIMCNPVFWGHDEASSAHICHARRVLARLTDLAKAEAA